MDGPKEKVRQDRCPLREKHLLTGSTKVRFSLKGLGPAVVKMFTQKKGRRRMSASVSLSLGHHYMSHGVRTWVGWNHNEVLV